MDWLVNRELAIYAVCIAAVWQIETKPFSIRIEGSAELKLNDSLNINFDVARSSIFDKQTEERL